MKRYRLPHSSRYISYAARLVASSDKQTIQSYLPDLGTPIMQKDPERYKLGTKLWEFDLGFNATKLLKTTMSIVTF